MIATRLEADGFVCGFAKVKAEFARTLDRAALRRDFRYVVPDLHEVIPTMTDETAPVARAVARAVREGMDRDAERVVSPGTCDRKRIDRIGRFRNRVAYGPGALDLARQPDEYVSVADMLDAATVTGTALAYLPGVEKTGRLSRHPVWRST